MEVNGEVNTDHLIIDTFSTVNFGEDTASAWTSAPLYANTITVTNGGVLDVNTNMNDISSVFATDTLELTSGNVKDNNGNVYAGVFDIHSNDYILNADLVNDRTNDTSKANYGYGVIAMNSDGHLTVNGNNDINNGDEVDNSSVDNVVAATGNYKVRIDNSTGAGAIADYAGKQLIYIDDTKTNATFSAANKADLGAYTYQAEQRGNTVVLQQMELTDYANMALSIPSANTNIWNLEQDTVGTRLTNSRHGLADNGGAWVTLLGWPKVQMGIESLQAFLRSAGALGVWVYTFLERILIPTGLHHFIYGPFIFGPAAVEGGIQMYWAQHLQEFSLSAEPLKSLFPEGGFALHGNSKIFGAVGISLAMYFTAAPENRVKVAGLLIPATLTAMLVGITEPLEFTFLFISPLLFAVHAVLAASMSTVMYLFGVVGNMGGGLIDQVLPQNWIPMFSNHADMMLTQIAIGLCFTLLYFVVFRTLILQFNMCTPGREDAEVKLYSKAEYKASRGQTTAAEPKKELDQAAGILQALGGVGNISSINNCATRLRIALHDMSQTLDDEVFKKLGAHGVFRSGDAIQVIIGLHVSQLREQLDSLINSHQSAENVAITEAV